MEHLIAILFASFIHQNTGDLTNIAASSDVWFNFTEEGWISIACRAWPRIRHVPSAGFFLRPHHCRITSSQARLRKADNTQQHGSSGKDSRGPRRLGTSLFPRAHKLGNPTTPTPPHGSLAILHQSCRAIVRHFTRLERAFILLALYVSRLIGRKN